jgi:S1-C subfamily serine protease
MQRVLARVLLLKQTKSWNAIEAEATAWITSHPQDATAFAVLVTPRVLNRVDRQSKRTVEHILREALAVDPDSIRGLATLVSILQMDGRYAEADEPNRRLLEIDPNNLDGLNNLAWSLVQQGQDDEQALELTTRALALGPASPNLLDTHGYICFRLKRFEEAEKYLRDAIQLIPAASPGLAVTRYHLGQVYTAMDRYGEAADLFQRSLNLHEVVGGLSPAQVADARELLDRQAGTSEGQGSPDRAAVSAKSSATAPPQAGNAPLPDGMAITGANMSLNDRKLYGAFLAGLMQLIETNGPGGSEIIRTQLNRDHCSFMLPEIKAKRMSLSELYDVCGNSVLVVGYLYNCPQCGRQHASVAGGFALAASGVIVTNYHVVARPEALATAAMTRDGRVYPVREVLAADKDSDVAILQLDGDGFTPLALSREAPAGTSVAVIGHPGQRFYSLTTGIISRHCVVDSNGKEIPWITATADIGPGSSGAPLLNEYGEVVGIASQTQLIQPARREDHQAVPPMVLDQFVPAASILRLIQNELDTAGNADHP